MTIGLCDMDFLYGKSYLSVNLFLAQLFPMLKQQGHRPIMMKAREPPTAWYDQVYYFLEDCSLKIPKDISPVPNKSLFVGHGFGTYQNVVDAFDFVPDFFPYTLTKLSEPKKKKLRRIANNNLIDWRTKDIKHWKKGKSYTFVHDADFLAEPDWKDIFVEFNNNIDFIRPLRLKTFEQTEEFMGLYEGSQNILSPLPRTNVKRITEMPRVIYDVSHDPLDYVFLFMLYIKCSKSTIHPRFCYINKGEMGKAMVRWYNSSSMESFNSYTNYQFQTTREQIFSPKRIWFSQNPTTADPQKILSLLEEK